MEEIRDKDTLVSLEYLEYKLLSEVKKDTVNKSKQGIEKKIHGFTKPLKKIIKRLG